MKDSQFGPGSILNMEDFDDHFRHLNAWKLCMYSQAVCSVTTVVITELLCMCVRALMRLMLAIIFFKKQMSALFEWDPDSFLKCVTELGTMHIFKLATAEINSAWFPDYAHILVRVPILRKSRPLFQKKRWVVYPQDYIILFVVMSQSACVCNQVVMGLSWRIWII